MWTKKKSKSKQLREYDRHMLRSAFVSLFWGVIADRRKRGKFTFQELANAVGTNKSVVSRWFSKPHPNWRVDTISDIAGALNLEILVQARDRLKGTIYTPHSVQTSPRLVANQVPIVTESEPTPSASFDNPTSAAA
jgi:hypothetical protein